MNKLTIQFDFFRWVDTLPDGPEEQSQSNLNRRNSTVSFFFPECFLF